MREDILYLVLLMLCGVCPFAEHWMQCWAWFLAGMQAMLIPAKYGMGMYDAPADKTPGNPDGKEG